MHQSVIIGYRAFRDLLMAGRGVRGLLEAMDQEIIELELKPVVVLADSLNLYWFASCRNIGGFDECGRPGPFE